MFRIFHALILLAAAAAFHGADAAAATVGAYYYPWYGPNAGGHHYDDVMRMHLTPDAQPPALGAYNSRDPNVIATHIDQSHLGNISMWSMSWWGPNSYEDVTIRNHILTHPRASEMSYTIHYETSGRLGSSAAPNYARFQTDMRYLGQNILNDPNYMRINGRPVIVLYLSRDYFRSQPGWDALASMRTMMQTEFGYDPYVIGDHFFGDLAPGSQYLDAVTAFDVYGQAFGGRPTNIASLNRLEGIYNTVQKLSNALGADFVPGLAPGYNDTAVRNGNAPSPRYLVNAGYGPTTQGSTMSEMLDRVVLPHLDADANDLILVNSFNEWHEDTQIEPTIVAPATNADDTPTGRDFTAGYEYEGYGNLYLDILRQKTAPPISCDFNGDRLVDDADLALWSANFGATSATTAMGDADGNGLVDGADFLDWQRHVTHLEITATRAVPEPNLAVLATIAFSGFSCVRVRRLILRMVTYRVS